MGRLLQSHAIQRGRLGRIDEDMEDIFLGNCHSTCSMKHREIRIPYAPFYDDHQRLTNSIQGDISILKKQVSNECIYEKSIEVHTNFETPTSLPKFTYPQINDDFTEHKKICNLTSLPKRIQGTKENPPLFWVGEGIVLPIPFLSHVCYGGNTQMDIREHFDALFD